MANKTQYRELHCEAGDHKYNWPVKRGRVPRNCPVHKPAVPAAPTPSKDTFRTKIKRILELLNDRGFHCTCGITEDSTWDELCKMEAGCCGGKTFDDHGYVCPVLDSVRRSIERSYTDEQLSRMRGRLV